MARGIQAGDKAPDFTLPSQSGESVRLHDRLGERVVVLYFYPEPMRVSSDGQLTSLGIR
jgi:peroxiredoxin Q/BCP